MMSIKVTSLLLLCIVIVDSIPFKVCGTPKGEVTNIDILGCTKIVGDVCHAKRNSVVTLEIDFVPAEDVSRLNAVVHGEFKGLSFPYVLSRPNACDNAGLDCPLEAGVKVQYKKDFKILSYYPTYLIEVRWELQDRSRDNFVCTKLKIKIDKQ